MIISDPCGWPKEGVNKKFSEEAKRVNSCLGSALDCVAWNEQRDGRWAAECLQGICVSVELPKLPRADFEKKDGR